MMMYKLLFLLHVYRQSSTLWGRRAVRYIVPLVPVAIVPRVFQYCIIDVHIPL